MKTNEERFEDFYAQYHHCIWRYCVRRLRPLEEAEEVFNSTFIVAWEDLSHLEINKMLGCSENAIGIRLHRARGRLDKQLIERRQNQKLKDLPLARHVVGQGAHLRERRTS